MSARPRVEAGEEERERFMAQAVEEAAKGLGRSSPNPSVGALLVKRGEVLARGHHARAGGPHAEVVVLRAAGARARGADLYTTLEPCDHYGRTPPCSRAILEAGVTRVFVGARDPNPVVHGRGLARLRRAGVEVVTGVLRRACEDVHAQWLCYVKLGRPLVTLKVALTLDGRIATRSGDARWITGEAARAEVHRLRDRVDAILVGSGTARADDPALTTRLPGRGGHQPLRVVLDSRLTLPRRLRLLAPGEGQPTLVATVARPPARHPAPRGGGPAGFELLPCRARRGRVDLRDLLSRLAARGVTHLLVEGGAEVHRAFLAEGLADRVVAFVAPVVLGGGRSWLDGRGPARMSEALRLGGVEIRTFGDDVMVRGALRIF